MSEWIDVNDRLPDTEAVVLVWAPNPYTSYFIAFRLPRSGEWCILNYDELTPGPVTHWMPLPNPPKKETAP